jgi:hypothetical protein
VDGGLLVVHGDVDLAVHRVFLQSLTVFLVAGTQSQTQKQILLHCVASLSENNDKIYM